MKKSIRDDLGRKMKDNQNIEYKSDIDWKLSFGIGCIIGAVIFIIIYGVQILDVTYDEWLVGYGDDPTMHYLGWRLFRNSHWTFPLGLSDNSLYPYRASIVYTDSIPLFALIFKLLSPILPQKFQYFGLFGIFCFMLQGGTAKILLRKKIKQEWLRNVGAIFFITNVVFIQRMFWHLALSAHFLILLGMILFIYRNDIKNMYRKALLWIGLGGLAISIQFYIYGMLSVMLVFFVIIELIDTDKDLKKIFKVIIVYIIPYIAITSLIFYVLGGFYGSVEVLDSNSGLYNADLSTLINPMGKSIFFSNVSFSDSQMEGFGYLGSAIIILLILALIGFLSNIKIFIKVKKKVFILLVVYILAFFIFALSPVVLWHQEYLFSMNIFPSFVVKHIWGLFRGCGRFIWPVVYLFIYLAVVYSQRLLKKIYPVVIVLLLGLQVFEFSRYYLEINSKFQNFEYFACPADVLYQYDLSQYKHIQFMKNFKWIDYYSTTDGYLELVGYTRLAMDKNMTVSNFHYARDFDSVVQNQIDKSYEKLDSGKPDSDTIYVFPKEMYEANNLHGKYKNVFEFDTGYDILLIPEIK